MNDLSPVTNALMMNAYFISSETSIVVAILVVTLISSSVFKVSDDPWQSARHLQY